VVCDLPGRGPFLTKTPHIIFEVLSPSTKKKDRQLKFLLYQEQGVAYYSLVDPAGLFAEVYRLENGKYRLEGEFKEQSYLFRIDGCHFDFSFSEVFDLEA
ncbi:MAG TPA: Uma2 family endonuclease, partial [Epsilonproteobacteria bacterium]|nr:Uma2 family endonuclease [Campylobacterota bacterium]